MKKLVIFVFAIICILSNSYTQSPKSMDVSPKPKTAVKAATSSKMAPKTVQMTFENEHINLGKVKRGEIRNFDYVFTNTGSETIEIDIASGCDCSTLDYPTHPIKPGQKAKIHVKFDSAKKEHSETVDVDLYLKNLNPKTGQRVFKILDFTFELTQ